MSKVEQDARLNARLIHDRPGRRFLANDDARWGELILPAAGEGTAKLDLGLRILIFASMAPGLHAVNTLVAFERRRPGQINLVGLVTDDPVNAGARISVKKRGWRFLDAEQCLEVEALTVEAALGFGVPVYTGEIKVDWFRRRAAQWRPDVILVCGFGQMIDAPIIRLPRSGIYNFHPSDLAQHHGAGPAPFEDLAQRDAATTLWTVHHVSEEVDRGQVVGQSPPINVRDAAGALPMDPMLVEHKLIDPMGYLIYFLVDALARNHHRGELGPLMRLDFQDLFSPSLKALFLQPIASQDIFDLQAGPDPAMFDPRD